MRENWNLAFEHEEKWGQMRAIKKVAAPQGISHREPLLGSRKRTTCFSQAWGKKSSFIGLFGSCGKSRVIRYF